MLLLAAVLAGGGAAGGGAAGGGAAGGGDVGCVLGRGVGFIVRSAGIVSFGGCEGVAGVDGEDACSRKGGFAEAGSR
jgi:hypothetical protein